MKNKTDFIIFVVYEILTDYYPHSAGGLPTVNYFKNATAQSFQLAPVSSLPLSKTTKDATIGWRLTGSRFVNCSGTGDLNPGINGYTFSCGTATALRRGFYHLTTNSSGQAASFYGPTSCSNYFNGPFIASRSKPSLTGSGTTCNANQLLFQANSNHCSGGGGVGLVEIRRPDGTLHETINSGGTGVVPISTAGIYCITSKPPANQQAISCDSTIQVTVDQVEIDDCSTPLSVSKIRLQITCESDADLLQWHATYEPPHAIYIIEESINKYDFNEIHYFMANNQEKYFISLNKPKTSKFYRIKLLTNDGLQIFSNIVESIPTKIQNSLQVYPNPTNSILYIYGLPDTVHEGMILNHEGKVIKRIHFNVGTNNSVDVSDLAIGVYYLHITPNQQVKFIRIP
jgi:hypothetical protein